MDVFLLVVFVGWGTVEAHRKLKGMTHAAGYVPGRPHLSDALHWLATRVAVYFAVAAGSAALFLLWATVYVFVLPSSSAPSGFKTVVPSAPPTELLQVVPSDSPAVDEELIAGAGAKIPASTMFGLSIYGPNNERVGQVTEIYLDRKGNAQAIVVGLDSSYWATKKWVVIPFKSVNLISDSKDTAVALKAERGIIPYDLQYLQKLPLGSHPLFPPSEK